MPRSFGDPITNHRPETMFPNISFAVYNTTNWTRKWNEIEFIRYSTFFFIRSIWISKVELSTSYWKIYIVRSRAKFANSLIVVERKSVIRERLGNQGISGTVFRSSLIKHPWTNVNENISFQRFLNELIDRFIDAYAPRRNRKWLFKNLFIQV